MRRTFSLDDDDFSRFWSEGTKQKQNTVNQ